MEQLTDEALVDQVRQGSMEAYGLLVDRHKSGIFTLIRCRVEEREAAEDLAQEVFIKLYRFLPGFRGEARFHTWLYQMTLNTIRDYHKAKRRRPATAVLDTVRNWFAEPRSGPEEQAILAEERETVVGMLRNLPDKYRVILFLHHYRQMSYSEIGELVGIPVKTVETRLYRGKKMLREQWLEVNGNEHESSGRSNAGAVPHPQADR